MVVVVVVGGSRSTGLGDDNSVQRKNITTSNSIASLLREGLFLLAHYLALCRSANAKECVSLLQLLLSVATTASRDKRLTLSPAKIGLVVKLFNSCGAKQY